MLRFFIIILSVVLTLNALTNSEILKRADKFVKSSNKSNQFRAYNDYKNLYLRAMMQDDTKLLKNSLSGIVQSGQRLHIDVAEYKKELASLTHSKKISYSYKPKKTFKTRRPKVHVKSSNRLKFVTWKSGRLVLQFDKKLAKNDVNYFSKYDMKRKKYQYFFDIYGSVHSSQRLRKNKIDNIKISQHNFKTIRLLIENKHKLTIRYKHGISSVTVNMQTTVKAKKIHSIVTHPTIAPQRLDRNKIIVIDAGHGGKDPGATGYRHYREKVVVLSIAKYLSKKLKSRGFKVYMTRDKDYFVKLSRRTQYANRKHADIFISIHANAVSLKNAKKVQGIETYFLSKSRSARAKRVAEKENKADLCEMDYYGKESFLSTLNSHNIVAANKLAIDLQRGALGALNKKYKNVIDAGVREGPFWVLVGAQMPSVLVEVGFITHPTEAKRLVNSKYQQALATGLANGVERYFLNN